MALGRSIDRIERNIESIESKITKIFKRPKHREDGSDFDDGPNESSRADLLDEQFSTDETSKNISKNLIFEKKSYTSYFKDFRQNPRKKSYFKICQIFVIILIVFLNKNWPRAARKFFYAKKILSLFFKVFVREK